MAEAWEDSDSFWQTVSGLTPGQFYSDADHKYAYFSSRSGLTPVTKYSVTDHEMAYLRNLGYSGSIDDMEYQFRKTVVGALTPPGTIDDYTYRMFLGTTSNAGVVLVSVSSA